MLDSVGTLVAEVEKEIKRRWSLRDVDRELSDREKRKLESVCRGAFKDHDYPLQVIHVFLDHAMPSGESFIPMNNLYFEWKQFEMEKLYSLVDLLPISSDLEDAMSMFIDDWKQLAKGLNYYREVYTAAGAKGGMKMPRFYRHSSAFYKLFAVLIHFQKIAGVLYPLFTMRSFLASQIEYFSKFIPRLSIGNLTSEAALTRYEDWYCQRFYPAELQKRANSRPSDNNPINNVEIRVEYERKRIEVGSRAGEFIFEGEQSVVYVNQPWIYTSGRALESKSVSSVVVPEKLKDIVG